MQAYRDILDTLPVALARVSDGGVFLYVNAAFGAFFRADPASLIGRHLMDVTDPGDREVSRVTIERATQERREIRLVQRCTRDDGETIWGGVTVGPLTEDGVRWVRLDPLSDPATARAHHRALREAHDETAALGVRFQAVVEGLDEGVVVWSGTDPLEVMVLNRAAQRMLGCEDGVGLAQVVFVDDDGQPSPPGHLATHAASCLAGGGAEQVVTVPRDGETRWLRIRAYAPEGGAGVSAVTIITDITVGRHAETLMRHRMFHDPLTGLANRALLMDRLAQAVQRLKRGSHRLGVMFLDLDRFKEVNDSLGHDAGDHVLVEVAHMLKAAVRPEDTVARLGGDEFVIVCEVDSADALWALADRLQTAARPVVLGDREIPVSYSIGLAMADGPGSEPAVLIRDADAAMYRAKERGRGRSQMFSEASRGEAVARLAAESELKDGLSAGEIKPYFQPVVDLASMRVVGTEALARWCRPDGMWLPATFLDLAEDAGLMLDLGRGIVEVAGHAFRDALGSDLRAVHLNCSSTELATVDYASQLGDLLGSAGIDPGNVVVEVTEQVMQSGVRSTMRQLHALDELGVSLALDHFGMGVSSLTQVQSLPISVVKVHRSFVAGLPHDVDDQSIVRGIIGMAGALGLTTIAVGVETSGQLDWLRENGCDQVQGFLLGEPCPQLRTSVSLGSPHTGD